VLKPFESVGTIIHFNAPLANLLQNQLKAKSKPLQSLHKATEKALTK